jgi:Flp pilus assembly protein TadD
LNLAVTYARAGRLEDARTEAREAARLDPGEPRTLALLKKLGPG